jgi:hypothetical protein
MSLRTTTRTLLSSALRTRTTPLLRPTATAAPRSATLTHIHHYHPTPSSSSSRKDDQDPQDPQDRHTLNPQRAEGTCSGTDDEVAAKTDASFNPKKTAPAEERAAAAGNGNPLDASGANQEFSRSLNEGETPADKSGKKVRSKAYGGKKAGKVAPMP